MKKQNQNGFGIQFKIERLERKKKKNYPLQFDNEHDMTATALGTFKE